jgi:hypothetical protein
MKKGSTREAGRGAQQEGRGTKLTLGVKSSKWSQSTAYSSALGARLTALLMLSIGHNWSKFAPQNSTGAVMFDTYLIGLVLNRACSAA